MTLGDAYDVQGWIGDRALPLRHDPVGTTVFYVLAAVFAVLFVALLVVLNGTLGP